MTTMHREQAGDLADAVVIFAKVDSGHISQIVEKNSVLLISWVNFLNTYHQESVAKGLLDALGSSIREVAGSLSLGLIRPSLFSLRAQIDLIFAWVYFKDHSVEWERVNETGDGFKLKKELLEYFSIHFDKFNSRLTLLTQIATRKTKDPYRLLSAHIHGQSAWVFPAIKNLKDLVRSAKECTDCVEVVLDVSEYISDVLVCIYAAEWHSLPAVVRAQIETRFVDIEQRKRFFG